MRTILSTLKEKNRYLVYEVEGSKNFDAIKSRIEDSVLKFLGEYESGKANVLILDDFKNSRGIIKSNNKYVDKVKVALMLIKSPVIQCIGVSGTIKKARLKFGG